MLMWQVCFFHNRNRECAMKKIRGGDVVETGSNGRLGMWKLGWGSLKAPLRDDV